MRFCNFECAYKGYVQKSAEKATGHDIYRHQSRH